MSVVAASPVLSQLAWRPPCLRTTDVGTSNWWQWVGQQGTPLVTQSSPTSCRVTFLWRESALAHAEAPLQQVWLWINGITDHHAQQQPVSLIPLASSDVWYATVELPHCWCGSYCLLPDTQRAEVFSSADIALQESDEQRDRQWQRLRRWWQTMLPMAQSDPLNNGRSWQNGRGHPVSPLHLPDAPLSAIWQSWEHHRIASPLPSADRDWQRHEWQSLRLGNTRSVWLMPGRQPVSIPRRLVIILDGGFWVEQMSLATVLSCLHAQGKLPEADYLFIDSLDNATRRRELPCQPIFWEAVIAELLPHVEHWLGYGHIRGETILAGQSFGGLSALYAALNWRRHFNRVISLSGSLWWPQRSLKTLDRIFEAEESLLGQLVHTPQRLSGLKVFLAAGRYEPLIQATHQRLLEAIKSVECTVDYHLYEGGHDAIWWREAILEGLLWQEQHP